MLNVEFPSVVQKGGGTGPLFEQPISSSSLD